MHALLINPYSEEVTTIKLEPGLPALYAALSEPDVHPVNLLTTVTLPNGDTLYLDDEGHLHPGRRCWALRGYDSPLAGRGLVLGVDGQGEDRSTVILAHHFKPWVTWTRTESTGEFGPTTEGFIQHPIFGRMFAIQGGKPITCPIAPPAR